MTPAGVPLASVPVTTVMWVRSVVDALTECGLDGMALSSEAGIPPAVYSVPDAVVPAVNIARLWQRAVSASGNPGIGLRAGHCSRPAALDKLGYLMMSSAVLRESLERAVRYHGSHSNATRTSLVDVGGDGRLEFHIMEGIVEVQRANHDFIMLTSLKFLRFVAGPHLLPALAEFAFAEPEDRADYAQAFGCPLAFGAPRTALTFTADDLEKPLLTANPLLASVLESAVNERMASFGQRQTTIWVRQLVAQALVEGEPSREQIARVMQISTRVLQRLLEREGTNFSEVLDDVRRNLARHHLGNGRVALSSVASLLGFSEQSAFTRACHRWFAATPSQFRRKLDTAHPD